MAKCIFMLTINWLIYLYNNSISAISWITAIDQEGLSGFNWDITNWYFWYSIKIEHNQLFNINCLISEIDRNWLLAFLWFSIWSIFVKFLAITFIEFFDNTPNQINWTKIVSIYANVMWTPPQPLKIHRSFRSFLSFLI